MNEVILSIVNPSNAFGFNEFRNLKGKVITRKFSDDKEVVSRDANQHLFDLIFAVNPITKLPSGDVQQYLSDNVSPQIREFIRQQFLQPSNGGVIDSHGLSDDEISDLSRHSGESFTDYKNRMVDYVNSLREKPKTE